MIGTLAILAAFGIASQAATPRPTAGEEFVADRDWKPLGDSIWFDPGGRRLILRATVVLREGALEHLLCLKGTKEHEAILATKAAPRLIHAGLLLTGAEPGRPVQFLPEFKPPSGPAITIELQWKEGPNARTANARSWVLDAKGKSPMTHDWVFAGSQLVEDPDTKQRYYLADDGDLITVANFASAILDVPYASSAEDSGRLHVARTEAIPPMGTAVTMILKPLPTSDKRAPARTATP